MKKFKKFLAAALVCVMALTMLTACGGWKSDEHKDKIYSGLKAKYTTLSRNMDGQAEGLLDKLDDGDVKIENQSNAVMVNCTADDDEDTAEINKEVAAIVSALGSKTPTDCGIAIGKVDGDKKIVVVYSAS